MKHGLGYFLAASGGFVAGALVMRLRMERKHREELKTVREDLYTQYKSKLAEKTEEATKDVLAAYEEAKTELCALRTKKKDEELFAQMKAVIGHDPTPLEMQVQSANAYIIRPDEFGDNVGYSRARYIFFPDQEEYLNADTQILADPEELKNIFEDVRPDEHFGQFDDDVVYVRNDALKMDIVIYREESVPDQEE